MLKLSEPRFVSEGDYESLKDLWQTSFDDSRAVLDAYFGKTVTPQSVIAVFEGEIPVSAMHLLPYRIVTPDGQSFYAYYVYGVCTHPRYRGKGLMKRLFDFAVSYGREQGADYLVLIPAEEYLFLVYEKLGFKTGFFYDEKRALSSASGENVPEYSKTVTYDEYASAAICRSVTVAVPCERSFNGIYNSVSSDVGWVNVPEKGWALFERLEEEIIVRELYGDENVLLPCVFKETGADSAAVRIPCRKGEGIPYGMYLKILDCPDIDNGFFGMPYAT